MGLLLLLSSSTPSIFKCIFIGGETFIFRGQLAEGGVALLRSEMSGSAFALTIVLGTLFREVSAITCYKCESYRDFRCLDPFDYRPHIQVNCDYEPFVRDRKPVFCEKSTELIDGVYVTTRGCSTKQWEDVDVYFDHRNQDLRCFRRGTLEQCLCSTDSCNGAKSMWSPLPAANIVAAIISVLCI